MSITNLFQCGVYVLVLHVAIGRGGDCTFDEGKIYKQYSPTNNTISKYL